MSLQRNSINLDISGKEPYRKGCSRFGGRPDIPEGFEWPRFCPGEGRSAVPLSFIAQFDCSALRQYDDDNMLPDHGVLSFFYETDSMRWGIPHPMQDEQKSSGLKTFQPCLRRVSQMIYLLKDGIPCSISACRGFRLSLILRIAMNLAWHRKAILILSRIQDQSFLAGLT